MPQIHTAVFFFSVSAKFKCRFKNKMAKLSLNA